MFRKDVGYRETISHEVSIIDVIETQLTVAKGGSDHLSSSKRVARGGKVEKIPGGHE